MNAWIHRTISAFIFLMLFGAVLSPVIAADLTREQAAKILKKKLILPLISEVRFSNDGFERAKQDCIVIVKSTGFLSDRNFTSKGLQMVGYVIKENGIGCPEIGTGRTCWFYLIGGLREGKHKIRM